MDRPQAADYIDRPRLKLNLIYSAMALNGLLQTDI